MALLIVTLFILLLMGVRIAYAIGISALVYVLFNTDVSLMIMAQQISAGADTIILVALPFFLLAGELMNAGGITDRLIRFAMSIIGRVSGGLSFVVVVTNVIMAAVSGAAIASGAAVGSVMIRTMVKEKYSRGFAGAVNAAAATIGPVIPPSIGLIIYASVSNASVGKLFIAGTIPGLLLGLLLLVVCYLISKKRGYPRGEKRNLKEIKISFKEGIWSLMMPVIIIGGILSGVVTATEAGVLAVVYGLVVSLFVYKSITWRDLPRILGKTARQTAIIMVIIASASAFGWIISREVEPQVFVDVFLTITDQRWLFMLVILGVILVLGMVMEGGSIMIILTPLLLPILNNFGIDLVHFGIVFQLAIMVGLITPPVGILLFVIAGAGDVPVKEILKEIWPFYLAIMAVMFICAYIPEIPLWLLNFYGGK